MDLNAEYAEYKIYIDDFATTIDPVSSKFILQKLFLFANKLKLISF